MKIDGHIHCDKFRHHDQLRDALVTLGIDGIICTDHFKHGKHDYRTFRHGYDAAVTACRESAVKVFAGAEITIDNDYLVYGLTMDQLEGACAVANNFFSLLEYVHRLNGLVIQAHPCRVKRGFFRQTLNQNVDGYENINGHHKHDNHNGDIELMMDFRNKVFTAGSDAHGGVDLGRAYMEFPGNPIETESELAATLKNFPHVNAWPAMSLSPA